MILFIREGCKFCDYKNLDPKVMVAKVLASGKIEIQGDVLDLPLVLKGLPTLLDGTQLFVGKDVIEDRLKALDLLKTE